MSRRPPSAVSSPRPVAQAPRPSPGLAATGTSATTTGASILPPRLDAAGTTGVSAQPGETGTRASISNSGPAPFFTPSIYNPEELYRAYLAGQREIGELKEEIARLRAQLVDAQLEQRRSRGKRAVQATTTDALPSISSLDPALATAAGSAVAASNSDTVADISKTIMKDGAYFGAFHVPFINAAAFGMPRPTFGPDDLERYTTVESQALGLTAEIYATVDARFHALMSLTTQKAGKNYFKLFKDGLDNNRSSTIRVIRRDTGAYVFDLPAHLFAVNGSESPRNTDPKIRKLLGYAVNSRGITSYERFPPVLYRNENDTSRIWDRFSSPYLFMIARTVMFGKSATKRPEAAIARSVSAYIRTGEIPRTTFGFIAWISTLARYVLSPDPTFRSNGIGSVTLIPYLSDLEFYKRWLVEAKHNPASVDWVTGLLDEWNREVFSTHIKATGNHPDAEVVSMDDDPSTERDTISRELDMFSRLSLDNNMTPSTPAPPATAGAPTSSDSEFDSDFYVNEPTHQVSDREPPAPLIPSTVLPSTRVPDALASAAQPVSAPPPFIPDPTHPSAHMVASPLTRDDAPVLTQVRRSDRTAQAPVDTAPANPPEIVAGTTGRGGRRGRGRG